MHNINLEQSDISDTAIVQEIFWEEIGRIISKGISDPKSLTLEEIQRVCQLALVAMSGRLSDG